MTKIKEEKAYVYLALIFGILFLVLIPPFQSPDENSHFKKSYQISKGNLYAQKKGKKVGDYFPKDMINYIDEKITYMGERDKKYKYSSLIFDNYNNMNYNDKKFVEFSTANTFPIVYFAPSIGIVFSKVCARIFGLDMVSTAYMLYFARLFCLITSIFITYYAIKTTPVYKKTFTIVALMPMTLYLSSMITYDNVINSLVFLTLAIILKNKYDKNIKKISKKDLIILTIIAIILFNVKVIYSLIFILMLLIPVEKYGGRKIMIKKAIIMIFAIIVITILFKIPILLNSSTAENSSITSKQLSFVINHPIKYLGILGNNIIKQRFFQFSSLAGMFGLVDTYLPFVFIPFIYIFLLLTSLADDSMEKIKIDSKFKIFLLIYILLDIVAIYSVMYISWTSKSTYKIGGPDILGVQGRYFIPLVLPFLMLFSNKIIKENKVLNIVRNNYLLLSTIFLTVSISIILLRFWV